MDACRDADEVDGHGGALPSAEHVEAGPSREPVQTKLATSSWRGRLTPTSAAGELILHVFDAVAHFERRLISDVPATASRLRGPRENCVGGNRSMATR